MIPDREKYVNLEDVKITLHNTDSLGKAAWDVISLPYIEMPKWIPVTERLPEKDDIYLVNVKDGWFPKNVLPIDLLNFEGGKWKYFEFETGSFEDFENPVVAWMPLPVPYEGVTHIGGKDDKNVL